MVEGTVKIDNSEKLRNLYTLARQAKDSNDAENAVKYEAQTPRCVFRMTDEHTQYPVLDWEEWQTNVLTSYLLLPKELVYRHMADVGLKDGISVLNRIYARKDYERFWEAAKRLGVSKTALTIRLSQLGLVGRNDLYDPYALVDIFPEKNEIA